MSNQSTDMTTSDGSDSSGLADVTRATVSTASSEVHDLTSQAVGQAADVLHDVRDQVRDRADAETRRAAEAIAGVGQQLRSMADGAAEDGPAVRWVREAGERSQRMADRLEQEGPQGVVDDIQRFARRRPGMFLAGMGLAGFALGRMLRNTSSSSSNGSGWQPRHGAAGEIDLRDEQVGAGRGLSSSTSGLSLETPDNLSGQVPSGMRADAGGVRSDG